MRCFSPVILLALSLCGMFLSSSRSSLALAQENKKAQDRQITVRGQVACLDESGRRLKPDQECGKESPHYQLLNTDGQTFTFSPDDLMATMFAEPRVRRMELQITGLLNNDNQLELIKIQSIHDGKIYDIFYYCEVCKITAYGAGPCPCCYQPLEFIERAVDDK